MVQPTRSTSNQPPRSCKGPGSTLRTDGYRSTPQSANFCGLGLLCSTIVCARFARTGSPLGWSSLWLVVVACLVLACASIAHWGWLRLRRCRVCPCCPTLVRPVSLRGEARWIGRRRWRMPRRRRLSQRWTWKSPFWRKKSRGVQKSFLILFKTKIQLCARVAQGDPTQSSDDTHIISFSQVEVGTEGTRARAI